MSRSLYKLRSNGESRRATLSLFLLYSVGGLIDCCEQGNCCSGWGGGDATELADDARTTAEITKKHT